jgi:RNA polymerase sigma factor (sigma-70 family)
MATHKKQSEADLAIRYRHSLHGGREDVDARNALIELHLPMIRWAAKRIQSANLRHLEVDELVGVGCIGMIEGLRRFDPARGYRVSTYCLPWVKNAMHKHVREVRWSSYLPEQSYRKLMKLHKVLSTLPARFDAHQSAADLARAARIDVDDCHQLQALTRALLSVETPISRNGRFKIADVLRIPEGPSDAYYQAVDQAHELIEQGLETLTDEERWMIEWHFFHGEEPRYDTEDRRTTRYAVFKKLRKVPAIVHARKVMQDFQIR